MGDDDGLGRGGAEGVYGVGRVDGEDEDVVAKVEEDLDDIVGMSMGSATNT